MNFFYILLYPFIAICAFFGNLFKHKSPEGEGSGTLSDGRPITRSEISQLSLPLLVTPFIRRGESSEARQKARVTPDIEGVQTYSGFFTVNEACSDHLFFWFVPAEVNWKEAPLVLWLNGGPGGSSLFGLFHEVGPWKFNNGKLTKNNYSWNKIANILFIDQPVETGFSFSEKGCFSTNKDDTAEALYSAVTQFLIMFPELQTSKFFLSGMSFAGHYIPETAALIDKKNQGAEVKINLAGIVVGSPSIQHTCNHKGDLLYELGVVDEHDRDTLNDLHKELVRHVESRDLKKADDADHQILLRLKEIGLPNYFNVLADKPEPISYAYSAFVSSSETKQKIHVGDSSHQYSEINQEVFRHYKSAYFGDSSAPAIKYLVEKNYIVGFFYGQLDVICAYSNFNCAFKGMEWEGFKGYLNAASHPLYLSNRLAGWFKVFKNLFTVLIRNGGHNIPEDQAEIVFVLMSSVLNSSPENIFKNFT